MAGLHERAVELANRAAVDSPAAAEILARLSGPLAVALAGRVNAGKSTLLNALLGERLALTDATECTRVVTRYAHGQVYSASASTPDGRPGPVPFERDSEGLRAVLPTLGGVLSLQITAPNPTLRTLTLIDTPGLGSTDAARIAATNSAIGAAEAVTPEADAIIYLLRHAHRTDVDTLEALRDRWAGNGSAFNVVAVLSRADEIGSARLDAMESAATIAARYEADGRLRGLATRVLPVSGLLAETGMTLREDEYGWLRTLADGGRADVDRLLLAAALFLDPSATSLTIEVRRQLLQRFGLFGVRLAIARFRDGSVSDASALARLLVDSSGLAALRVALTQQFGARSRVLQALTALDGLRQVARTSPTPPVWARVLEEIESGSHELAEMRTLQAATDGLLGLPAADQRRLALLLGESATAHRLALPSDAGTAALRDAALRAIADWRTRSADPMLDRLTADACETCARAAERIFADLPD